LTQIKAATKNIKLKPITNVHTINLEQHLINKQNTKPRTNAIPKLASIIGQVTPKSLVEDSLSPRLAPFSTSYSIFLLSGKHMTPKVGVVE